MRIALLLPAMLLAASPSQAHDLWIERSGSDYALLHGHRHSSHAGAETIPYRPDTVHRMVCFDTAAAVIAEAARPSYPARLSGGCAAVYALLCSGYWTKTPYGTRNLPKDEVDSAINAWLSFEGVKRIDHWDDALARSLTQDLELVPLNNPLTLSDGEKLQLLVSFRGQPVAGATVAYDGKPRGETGPDGRINIRVRHGGLQSIEASLRRPLDGTKADQEVHTTTLVFALGGSS